MNIVTIENEEKSIIGSRLWISATSGEKIVKSLAGKLQKPSAVAAKSTGNKSKLQRKQMQKADEMPNFAKSTRNGNSHDSIEGSPS